MAILVALLCGGFGAIAPASPLAQAHWGYTNVTPDSITMMAGALALDGQPNWYYYNAGDAPEGAYMGWLNQAQTLTATVHLPRALAPGRYVLFFGGTSYDSNETLMASIGGGTSTSVTLDDRDANRYWSDGAVVDVATSSDALEITLTRNASLANDQKYLLKSLYITASVQETVTWDGRVIKLVAPTVMDDSAPVKGNLVPNGGFETGVDASWGFAGQGGGRTVPVNTMWDSTQGYEGQGCLKLTFDAATRVQPLNSAEEIISRVYHVKPNRKHTLSMWMKASPGLSTAASISLRNTYVPAQSSISSGSVTVGDTWTRVSVTGYLLEYPTSDYQVYIDTGGPSGTYLLIDAVQLEEGDLTDYAPAAGVEAAVLIDMVANPGNILYEDESVSAILVARNGTSTPVDAPFRYETYDFMNRLVGQGSQTLSLAAHTTQQTPLGLSVGKRGVFRIVSWIEGQEHTERELVYSVIPRPPVAGADPTSCLGIHPNYTDFQLGTLQRMGVKWSRVLSPSAFFRWSIVEPVEGQITWYDAELQRAADHGIATMGTIGTNNYWPAWADNNGLPDLTKWETFVGQLAAHYSSSQVPYWEIWNEPAFTADFYAQMLKRAVDAIETNNPTAKIVGMGGVSLSTMQAVIAALETRYPTWDWKQHIHVLSTHDYPDGQPPEGFKSPIIDTYGVPVWNTETGAWCLGLYQGVDSNFVAWGSALFPYFDAARYYEGMIGAADSLVGNFLRTIASGQSRYFYYDSRLYAAPDCFKHHPTIMEYDGTVRTKGIAYAIAGSLIDHSTGLGNAVSGQNSYLLVFDRAGGPVAALFSADKKPRQITLSGVTASQFQVLDMMGNPVATSGSTVAYGRIPVYLKGIGGITAATLKSALQNGTISARADTDPPNVSISDGPRGPVAGGAFRVRWIAIDDTSYPNLGEINPEAGGPSDAPNPEAILYSYRLVGSSDWSAWVSNTYADFAPLPDGAYTFEVQAKDEAGNVSSVASRSIIVGAGPHGGSGSHRGGCGSVGLDLMLPLALLWLLRRRRVGGRS